MQITKSVPRSLYTARPVAHQMCYSTRSGCTAETSSSVRVALIDEHALFAGIQTVLEVFGMNTICASNYSSTAAIPIFYMPCI